MGICSFSYQHKKDHSPTCDVSMSYLLIPLTVSFGSIVQLSCQLSKKKNDLCTVENAYQVPQGVGSSGKLSFDKHLA